MEKKHKSMDDLPVELVQKIFLMLPAKQLFRLRCVSKLWHSLISDPHFAQLHFNLHSATPSPSFLFIKDGTEAHFVHLDPLMNVSSSSASASPSVKEVSFPFKMAPFGFCLIGCCRGFVLLNGETHFLVVSNPLTGSSKRILYSHIVSRSNFAGFKFTGHSALPKPVLPWFWEYRGLFLNGAIHWLSSPLRSYIDAILMFDLKERSFSKISVPEQLVGFYANLKVLGECLALEFRDHDNHKSYMWVMKEYKVQSSWTLMCEIPSSNSKVVEFAKNVLNNLTLLKIGITRGSNEEKESRASIH
ncbi:hypothetical protein PIB30_095717, partial [Stylosanthes scabra]|nr:hypothetical protein [Stylosanthes scabra]